MTANPGLSVARILLIRLRILVEFVVRRVLIGRKHRRALKETGRLADHYSSRTALVIANGPSTKKLDLSSVKEAKAGGLFVVAMNYYPLSEEMKELIPDLLVLSDPAHRISNTLNSKNMEMWNILRMTSDVRLAVPSSWFDEISAEQGLARRTHYFNDLALEGWTRNINPLRPRGYISMTAYKAIAFALFLGFSEVSVIGVDNTFFQTLEVDTENRVVQLPNHFFAAGSERSDMTHFYTGGVAEYFRDVSLCFDSLARCFAGHPIVNLDPDSLVDCFPKRINCPYIKYE